jgi:hypothetical protein
MPTNTKITIELAPLTPATLRKIRRCVTNELTANTKNRKAADSVALRTRQNDLVLTLAQLDRQIGANIAAAGK